MAALNSNNYLVAVVPEVSRGAQVTNLSTGDTYQDVLEWNYDPIVTDKTQKENNLAERNDRSVITAQRVSATLSGQLTWGHDSLLSLFFDDNASPYLFSSTVPTTKSANIYQLYLGSDGATTHYDVILGAVIQQLEFRGTANGLVEYTATIQGTSYLQMVANSAGGAITAIPAVDGALFQFGSVTASLYTAKTALNSFTLTLQKTMVDDKSRYQNSLTMSNDRYIGVGGTLAIETLWDGTADAAQQANRFSQTAKANTITLVNASGSWAFLTYGIVTEATRPDADRGEFMASDNLKLVFSGANAPVTVTVTAA